MDTRRDILLDRKPGKINTLLYLKDALSALSVARGFDVIQFINPNFLSLKPNRIKYFFDKLKRQNRSLFLTLAGNDYFFVRACFDKRTFRFSEFMTGDRLNPFELETHRGYLWMSDANRDWNSYFYDNIDGGMSLLPEYDMAARPILGERLKFTNLPIDLANLPYSSLDPDTKIRLFIGMRGGMETQKGTALLLDMCRKLEREMPDRCETVCVRNLSLSEYLSRMKQSHIVLDQLYSYSPGTNGFQAMALGRVAATGGQPEYYEYIGEPAERPIIPLSPMMDREEVFRDLILNPSKLMSMSSSGRKLVEKHNDVKIVASKFEQHWHSLIK